ARSGRRSRSDHRGGAVPGSRCLGRGRLGDSPLHRRTHRVPSAGATLIGSLALAIWSSSKYIGAFGRALNTVYRVEESRPYWKFKPLMLLITVVTLIVMAALGLLLVLSGPIAESLGELIGMGPTALL